MGHAHSFKARELLPLPKAEQASLASRRPLGINFPNDPQRPMLRLLQDTSSSASALTSRLSDGQGRTRTGSEPGDQEATLRANIVSFDRQSANRIDSRTKILAAPAGRPNPGVRPSSASAGPPPPGRFGDRRLRVSDAKLVSASSTRPEGLPAGDCLASEAHIRCSVT